MTNVAAPGRSASYQYEPVGNRLALKQRGSTSTYTYDKADRLTSIMIGGTATTYA